MTANGRNLDPVALLTAAGFVKVPSDRDPDASEVQFLAGAFTCHRCAISGCQCCFEPPERSAKRRSSLRIPACVRCRNAKRTCRRPVSGLPVSNGQLIIPKIVPWPKAVPVSDIPCLGNGASAIPQSPSTPRVDEPVDGDVEMGETFEVALAEVVDDRMQGAVEHGAEDAVSDMLGEMDKGLPETMPEMGEDTPGAMSLWGPDAGFSDDSSGGDHPGGPDSEIVQGSGHGPNGDVETVPSDLEPSPFTVDTPWSEDVPVVGFATPMESLGEDIYGNDQLMGHGDESEGPTAHPTTPRSTQDALKLPRGLRVVGSITFGEDGPVFTSS